MGRTRARKRKTGMWAKIRKILGIITDILLIGRGKGLWKKDQDLPVPGMRDPREGN